MSEKQQAQSPIEPESGRPKRHGLQPPTAQEDDAEGHRARYLKATPTDDGDANATDTEGHEKK